MDAIPAGHAWLIAALVVYALLVQLLGALSAVRKDGNGMHPGAGYEADYANPDYRLDRSYMQGLESLAYVAPVLIAAVLAGVWPLWAGILAWVMLALRLVISAVYLRGIGRGYNGLRTRLVIAHNTALGVLGVLVLVKLAF